jgi:hypothetical protein
MKRLATISQCGKYRYALERSWGEGKGCVVWVMLNPSTADASIDDPTIRKCIGFTRRWGHERLIVVNLFAFRATDPGDMKRASDPIGPENEWRILDAVAQADMVVVAWGAHGGWMDRDEDVLMQLHYPLCLGRTKDGHPKHPLMLAYSTPCVPFESAPKGGA